MCCFAPCIVIEVELSGSRPQGTWRRVWHGGMGRVTQVANEAGLCVFVLVAVVCVCTCECDACLRGCGCVYSPPPPAACLPTTIRSGGRLKQSDVIVIVWVKTCTCASGCGWETDLARVHVQVWRLVSVCDCVCVCSRVCVTDDVWM